jgi:hypothetical protein
MLLTPQQGVYSASCGRRTWRVHRQGDVDAARGVALWVLQLLPWKRSIPRQQTSPMLQRHVQQEYR